MHGAHWPPGSRARRSGRGSGPCTRFDLGGLAAAIKGLFAGSAGVGVKTVAALTVAAATTTTLVATDPGGMFSDRHSVRQARVQAAGSNAASGRPIAGTPIVEDALGPVPVEPRTELLGPDGDRPSEERGSGPADGQGNGKAKANGHDKDHGNGKGRAEAPGQVKKAENAPNEPIGHGAAHGGRPDHAGQGGPPPHAPANGLEKSKKVKEAKK